MRSTEGERVLRFVLVFYILIFLIVLLLQIMNLLYFSPKSLLLFLALLFYCCSNLAQSVSNVSATQQGQELVISYTLESESPCEVSLYVSMDSGRSWQGPLAKCTGDVGKDISGGSRQIRWSVLEEREQLAGNGIQFKVVASGRKSFEPEMVFVEGGRFMMGSNSGDEDEKPVHEVELSSYYIGKYEVTQAQWQEVMGNNPSYFKDCDQCPVESVSWNDVQDFIRKLNGLTGKNYRLPTEAEWEFAARGGAKSRGYTYSGGNDVGSVAWYTDNSSSKTHSVGGKQANELLIFDMTGNVWEWCSDWYGSYYGTFQRNPQGASSGQYLVLRGGGWNYLEWRCRVTDRFGNSADYGDYYRGFRLVLSPVQ
jgi:formylglycine-generating enzyme required for sulfatase activity